MSLDNQMSKKNLMKIASIIITLLLVTQVFTMIERVVVSPSSTEAPWRVPTRFATSFVPTLVPVPGGPDWFSFDNNETPPGTKADLHVTLSDTIGQRLVADFYGFWDKDIILHNETYTYDRPEIPGASFTSTPGQPELPRFTKIVEIPHNVNITVDVLQNTSAVLPNYNLTPAQPPTISIWNPGINMNFTAVINLIGTNDSYYPDYAVTLEGWNASEPQVMRGRRLLLVSFYPFQYNPFSNTLKVYSRVEIDLKYSHSAQIEAPNSSLFSLRHETMLMNELPIYKNWESEAYIDCIPPTPFVNAEDEYSSFPSIGEEYLIIAPYDFENAAERLAAWKSRKGVPTRVALFEIQSTLDDTRDLVQGIIDTAYGKSKVPTYILLFGDSDHIPPYYKTLHPDGFFKKLQYNRNDRLVATDLHYFTMDGRKDRFPDFFYGRISVDNPEDAENIVDKIIGYETEPPQDDYRDFFDNILAATFYEDEDGDTRGRGKTFEDRGSGFATYIDEARILLSGDSYQFHLNYTTNSPDYNTPGITMMGIHNNIVPFDLEERPDFKWILWNDELGAVSNITANINEGRFFVIYFDHGSSKNMLRKDLLVEYEPFDGWANPHFNTTSVGLLANDENRYPFVFSAACNVGWYDGETDQELQGSEYLNSFECLSEVLLRKSVSGAIAAVAASRFSYNLYSSDLLEGMIQSFWPSEPNVVPIYEFGAALQQARIYMQTMRSDDDVRQVSLEMYNLFGDPETSLWTSNPASFLDISIGADSIMTSGTQIHMNLAELLTISVGVPNARVCIQNTQGLYKVAYTNDEGDVTFDNRELNIAGDMNVTVTKQNYRPFLGIVDIIDGSASHLSKTNQGFYLSEAIAGPDPYIYSQWDPTTWHLAGKCRTYDNPCIEILDITGSTSTVANSYEFQAEHDRATDLSRYTKSLFHFRVL
ncbi:MAG: C25 family cysteine peptidase, partial [Candidatus Thorarchaeota archaeon]